MPCRSVVTRNFVNNTGNIGIMLGWYQELDEIGLTTAFALTQPALYQNINGTVSDNIITNRRTRKALVWNC